MARKLFGDDGGSSGGPGKQNPRLHMNSAADTSFGKNSSEAANKIADAFSGKGGGKDAGGKDAAGGGDGPKSKLEGLKDMTKPPKEDNFKDMIRNKAGDMLTAKAAAITKPMGDKAENFRKNVGNKLTDATKHLKRIKNATQMQAVGTKGFGGLYLVSKLSKGAHTAVAGFMNTQLGQLVELAYAGAKAMGAALKSGAHAMATMVPTAVGSAGAGALGAGTGGAGALGGMASFGAGAGAAIGNAIHGAAMATFGFVNGVVNSALGAIGLGVSASSAVPTIAMLGVLAVGGGGTYMALNSQTLTGACMIKPQAALTSASTSTGADATADMQQNARIVADYLKEAGAKGSGIAGYLGNAQHESGIDPTAIQSGLAYNDSMAYNPNANGYAFGLNQWDGGRRVNLLNFAKSQNKGWTDLNMQLDFALNHDGSDSKLLRQILGKNQSVAESAEDLRAHWERGGAGTTAERQAKAEYWYKTLNLSTVTGNDSIIGGASDSATSNQDAAAEAKANACGPAKASTDTEDGTGSVNANDGQSWAYNNLPADVAQYVHKVEDTGMQHGGSNGWDNFGGQCVHFASSYFYNLFKHSKKAPKRIVMVDLGMNEAARWAEAFGEKESKTPHAGSVASVPAYSKEQGNSFAGHTFVVEHVMANGDILIAEQNYGTLSGDMAGKPGTWNFRYITKATYEKYNMTFFIPEGEKPQWSK